MPGSSPHFVNVLKFWRAIETFTLPDVPAAKLGDGKQYFRLTPEDPLPWNGGALAPSGEKPSGDKQWKHTLYLHCFPKVAVTRALIKLAPDPSDEFLEPQSGTTCLASLVIDHRGQPLERTYVRSAFAYGLDILAANGNPETLQERLRKAQSDFPLRFRDAKEATGELPSSEAPVTWAMLEKELKDLRDLAGDALPLEAAVLCVSEEISPRTNPEASFMNTFYLESLNYLINHPEDLGQPLEIFLTRDITPGDRADLLTPDVMLASLDPGMLSAGRWPANPDYGLYSAQLAALNLTLAPLRKQSGLRGINGPPGTGKTTLLREVIADVVVARARRLLKADVTALFSAESHKITEHDEYYEIAGSVFGGDGILVTSNNNAAVENISRELPALTSIDIDTFAGADYFSAIAQNLDKDNKCWGLLSAVLGRATKKRDFVTDFWFDKANGFNTYLKQQYNDRNPAKTEEHKQQYAKVAGELQELLNVYDAFRGIASGYDDLLLKLLSGEEVSDAEVERFKELSAILQNEYKIPPANLPGLNFMGLSMEEIHKMTPYASRDLNILRSDIFLKSLELQACAIQVNAKSFRSNLNAFVDLLSGKLLPLVDEKVAAVLWNTFWFCVPVVSTTLASSERLFSKMGRGSIGWLLLDEAGQATPQSACGVIWRAQRAIIIGDTLQIPPVVTIPEGLGKLLQNKYSLEEPHWSPLHSSAQFLADRATPFGAYIDINGSQIWTGTPLRAHRRCEDPMFTISNQIAYNGQMVKVGADAPMDSLLPPSCWFDVKGTILEAGNIVSADVQALEEIVSRIRPDVEGDIFAISPFRAVSDYCDAHVTGKKRLRLTFGTIHVFQGKEADVVFLVLGMDPANIGARNWASSMPNLLNVAVTRARKRFYVIGDYDLWKRHNYFAQLAEILPRKEHRISTLF